MMGWGEPLANLDNVARAIQIMLDGNGLQFSNRRVTVSTSGLVPEMAELGRRVTVNLAVSLNATTDELRNQIMPINEHNNLETLADALKYYHRKTEKKVTYEYIVFNHFNDELSDAKELAKFARIVPCKINLIEYNPIDNESFLNASEDKIMAFKNYLHSQGFIVNLRRSRGKDIDAACGQLANKNEHAVVKLKKQYV